MSQNESVSNASKLKRPRTASLKNPSKSHYPKKKVTKTLDPQSENSEDDMEDEDSQLQEEEDDDDEDELTRFSQADSSDSDSSDFNPAKTKKGRQQVFKTTSINDQNG